MMVSGIIQYKNIMVHMLLVQLVLLDIIMMVYRALLMIAIFALLLDVYSVKVDQEHACQLYLMPSNGWSIRV